MSEMVIFLIALQFRDLFETRIKTMKWLTKLDIWKLCFYVIDVLISNHINIIIIYLLKWRGCFMKYLLTEEYLIIHTANFKGVLWYD